MSWGKGVVCVVSLKTLQKVVIDDPKNIRKISGVTEGSFLLFQYIEIITNNKRVGKSKGGEVRN